MCASDCSEVAERLKQLEMQQLRWEEFEKDVNALNHWFSDQTARLDKFHRIGHEVSVQHALDECKVRVMCPLLFQSLPS